MNLKLAKLIYYGIPTIGMLSIIRIIVYAIYLSFGLGNWNYKMVGISFIFPITLSLYVFSMMAVNADKESKFKEEGDTNVK